VSDRHRARLVLGSLLGAFGVARVLLWRSPDADLTIAGYNIHHLFTGLVLITAGGVPLALRPGRSRWLDVACVAFGAGLGLALDEWVYLIATDGSNASYLLPVSFRGGLIAIGLGAVWIALMGRRGGGGGGGGGGRGGD
jgi:hypothetical protein